jgi:nucleoside-diphosphate-sugar epimerase
MKSLVVLGAGGFLGRTLTTKGRRAMIIKAVARNVASEANLIEEGVTWFAADLSKPAALSSILRHDDVVINLAHASELNEAENVALIDNIFLSCLANGVRRLVHCSTAIVAGATRSLRITESTPCAPVARYQRMKLVAEQRLLCISSGKLDVGVLRPTAIVGPGGQNLLKLANSLRNDSWLANYLRASVFGRRPMHLVPATDVVAALLHLAEFPAPLNGNVYIAASDEDPDNNFRSVESILMSSMGLGHRTIPVVPLPLQVLSTLLNLMGRSDTNVSRTYDSAKLRTTNFRSVDSIASAVRDFAKSLQK